MSGRNEVASLIQDLQEACRRPLFTEICLEDSKQNNTYSEQQISHENSPKKKLDSAPSRPESVISEPDGPSSLSPTKSFQNEATKKSWREVLIHATKLLPLMTETDRGEVSHLVSILLLGYLLPHSTGSEYFLLQNTPASQQDDSSETAQTAADHTLDYILHMDLEERLESTCRNFAAFEFGEFDTLTDANWELAFDSFLRKGLAPFLGSKPAHLEKVDLLHILAMMIHPQPSAKLIPDTVKSLEGKHYWKCARRLMNNRHPHSFHVNYAHRLKIIKLIVQDLVIPPYDPDAPMINYPLFDGALPHLRASLHAFAMGAVSMEDAHWARSAIVTISVQSRLDVVLKEEWEFLINRMVDDRTRYPGCQCCSQMLQQSPARFFRKRFNKKRDDASFCPHAGRGQHLADILIRTCQARGHSNDDFLNEAFSSLTDAIEWQMHCWKQQDDSEQSGSEEPPCMLASLLFAAKHFFYFLLPTEEKQGGEQDDNMSDALMRRDELVSCAIQFCHHFDPNISSQAAELLCVALAYGSKAVVEESAKPLCLSLRQSIPTLISVVSGKSKSESLLLLSSTQDVVSAASRRSPSFALTMLHFLLELSNKATASDKAQSDVDKDGDISMKDEAADRPSNDTKLEGQIFSRLIASLAVSSPVVAGQNVDALVSLLKTLNHDSSRSHAIAALLACRQSRFFVQAKDATESAILDATSRISDRWNLYEQGRLAMRTGNFSVASQCFKQILKSPLSERYLVWISALVKISDSEHYLSQFSAKGIPFSTSTLRSALSVLQSLNDLDGKESSDFSFQISFVRLRLDFLDLLTGLRQLIREMRLTGSGPTKRTRSSLHFQNIVRCFDALARRCGYINRQYGLFFCQQSRSALRTFHALCRFVARSVRVVFSDVYPSSKKEEKWPGTQPSGDSSLAISRFMQRLDEGLLQKMSPALDTVIRAAAMLEVVDGILLCPVPFPLGFFCVSALPQGRLQLSVDPEGNGIDDSYPPSDHRIDCYPGLSFDFYASGEIPSSFSAKAKLPFCTVLLWHRARYVGPLQEDEHLPDEKQEDEAMADEKQEDDGATATKAIPRPWNYTLVSTNLLANGRFSFKVECPPIREEGNYVVEVILGCRDIRGGEWELPLKEMENSGKLDVQVTRSGSWHS